MIPRLWPGETVAILACGPSLTPEDVERVRGLRVIAINDSYRLAPWADVLYACDCRWWKWQHEYHRSALDRFAGLRVAMASSAAQWQPEWRIDHVMRNTGLNGLEANPAGLKNGRNSGYQAIGLAAHLGATRILLLGYDMSLGHGGKAHWFGDHPHGGRPPLTKFRLHFPTIAAPLKALGIEVLNCSRRSALTCFPKVSLDQALLQEQPPRMAAAVGF